MNWLFEFIAPISRGLAEHLVNGLILSAAIYSAFLVARPLFLNHRRGSAATSHRVLSFVFVALTVTPILTCLQPIRGEMNTPGPRPSMVAAEAPSPPEPSILDGQIQEALLGGRDPAIPWRPVGSRPSTCLFWSLQCGPAWLVCYSYDSFSRSIHFGSCTVGFGFSRFQKT